MTLLDSSSACSYIATQIVQKIESKDAVERENANLLLGEYHKRPCNTRGGGGGGVFSFFLHT